MRWSWNFPSLRAGFGKVIELRETWDAAWLLMLPHQQWRLWLGLEALYICDGYCIKGWQETEIVLTVLLMAYLGSKARVLEAQQARLAPPPPSPIPSCEKQKRGSSLASL